MKSGESHKRDYWTAVANGSKVSGSVMLSGNLFNTEIYKTRAGKGSTPKSPLLAN